MDPSAAGLIGAGIGVAGTLGVEALRQLATDRSKKADRAADSAGYHRDNLIGLQDSLLESARLTTLIIENRTSKTPAGAQWSDRRTFADPHLIDQWRLARLELLRFQVRIQDDDLRAAVDRCSNLQMAALFGQEHAASMSAHRNSDEILMGDINPKIGELLRATY
jgi:hypothetical protein